MRIVTQLTDYRFININEIFDPDNNVHSFFYAERLGTDSVAFICFDEESSEFLLNDEYKPPTNEFIIGAFGGSLDKDEAKEQIVLEEVREEAGFEVSSDNIFYVGRSFVSTQMNQYCYLYLVKVRKVDQKDRQPENAIEAMAETKWIKEEDIIKLEDWKSIIILLKAKSQGLI